MSVVVSRSARIKSRISSAAALLLLFASFLQLGNLFALRGLRRSVDSVPSIADVEKVVLATMDVWAASNHLSRSLSSSSSASPGSSTLSPRFVAVRDFCTWADPRGRMFARVDGVECAIGDYLPSGLVRSIRPGRVICQASDGSFVILGRAHKSSPGESTSGDSPGEDVAPRPLG